MKKEAKGRRSGSPSVNHEKRALIRLMLTGAYAIPLMATMRGNTQRDDDDLLMVAGRKKKQKGPPSTFPGRGRFGGKGKGGKGKAKGRPF